jgi:nitroimidazol reductase NimA-like FMN-containing flavoprotein (pyridoxamine 5'-phosphate oxidase superfamily)
MRVSGTWDEPRTRDYLRTAVVPARLATHTPSGGLWMLSLWYTFVDGSLQCATSADADVVGYLRADPEVAFEVSTNEPPYRGVRGAGEATVEPDPEKALLRELLERYLGGTDSALAADLLDPDRDEVRIRVEPERVYSWDFTDRMRDL